MWRRPHAFLIWHEKFQSKIAVLRHAKIRTKTKGKTKAKYVRHFGEGKRTEVSENVSKGDKPTEIVKPIDRFREPKAGRIDVITTSLLR